MPTQATARAMIRGCAFKVSRPPAISTRDAAGPLRTEGASPMTESTVKETILGFTISMKDTMPADIRLRTKKGSEPFKKCQISLKLESYFFIISVS